MAGAAPSALELVRALPLWTGPVEITPLPGGITNRNYLVAERGRRFVVRLGQDIPVHGILRFNEHAASRAAAAAGVSPEVVHAAPGVLVIRYVEGRTLAAADVRASHSESTHRPGHATSGQYDDQCAARAESTGPACQYATRADRSEPGTRASGCCRRRFAGSE